MPAPTKIPALSTGRVRAVNDSGRVSEGKLYASAWGVELRKRILIADDHEVMRKGLRTLLTSRTDWMICGEASNGMEAVHKAAVLEPDLVVMDVSMTQMDGMEATRSILKRKPEQKIVMYTMHESDDFSCAAMRVGAQGAVSKAGDADQILLAIEAVLNGRQFFPAIGQFEN